MTDLSPDLANMTIPVGLSARAATIIAKALKQYEDLCPTSEREIVEKMQAQLATAVSRVINDRERERRAAPSNFEPERVSRRPLPTTHHKPRKKQKSRADVIAEKMADAGRAAVDKHKGQ